MFIGNSNEKSVGALDNSQGISLVLDFLNFFFHCCHIFSM